MARLVHSHSHDAADSVDAALESSERGIRAVKISFAALGVTAIAQVGVVAVTDSIALLADTIHNFSDALTAVPLFIAYRIGRRAPTRRYTYGYGRAEDLAGIFVVLMIALSAVIAAYESVDRLLHPREIEAVGWLFAAGVIGFAGNELVAMYRIRVGEDIGSAALVADGYHARTDGFTSLAVALGAVGAALGFERADPLIGLLISVAIFAVLRRAAVQIYHRLMDAVDPHLVAEVTHVVTHVAGVQQVGTVQVRWVGHRLTVNVSVVVDRDRTVAAGHHIAEAIRLAVVREVRHVATVDVHVDPCRHDVAGPDVATSVGSMDRSHDHEGSPTPASRGVAR